MTGSQALPFLLAVASTVLLMAACSRSKPENDAREPHLRPARLTAATLGDQVVLPTDDYLQLPRYETADPERGRTLSTQCRACHSFEPGGPDLTGPNLNGFFGRRAGAVESYDYSEAFEQADFIWTPEALDAWLSQPAAFLPGNRMAFAGFPEATDRDAVVATLLRATNDPAQD